MAEEHRIYCVQTSESQLPDSTINLISITELSEIGQGLPLLTLFFHIPLKYGIYELY